MRLSGPNGRNDIMALSSELPVAESSISRLVLAVLWVHRSLASHAGLVILLHTLALSHTSPERRLDLQGCAQGHGVHAAHEVGTAMTHALRVFLSKGPAL